ncbi:hypothetical protein L202_01840 [Cryptococcus amylolentus CBS 6039]|uniref:Uncharacterized protein n=1 Tax=Cryptococcus amylolentus CBS 6039 TaxID=1295533 RepID=A0A1E3I5H2_9TREE|nr:hypothetical protein L202_01840 [Cryptococcus amylolentus CBS 6039]ODN83748.1 hypothetical protein L202_01840 [Cryptococcus amylolentus CBS 6039]
MPTTLPSTSLSVENWSHLNATLALALVGLLSPDLASLFDSIVLDSPSCTARTLWLKLEADHGTRSSYDLWKSTRPIRRDSLTGLTGFASFKKSLRTADGADAVINDMPTSTNVDVEGSDAKVMHAQLTPVYFPGPPIGTPHPNYPFHISLEKPPLDIFSHAHIHTSDDIELGLQTYNRIAPPISTNTSAKGESVKARARTLWM